MTARICGHMVHHAVCAGCREHKRADLDARLTQADLPVSEHDEQAALFEWADWHTYQCPELGMLYAIPNGQVRPGQRLEPGLKAGVPDIHLPVARRGFHGLYIELKVGSNRPKPEQVEWLNRLSDAGYRAVCCWGQDEAKDVICCDYLEIER